ncbi:autotransporter assembly complex protein TamA [Shewanella woodyi]|uniref:Translocation and assembly module subunit TamA n=1 Tax=Shewanella woodyi (strain ATCC 51908 / MS32) TaxID=392500 RepID=B1KIB2_SHEWM|nr:autotransporter assembly complex family protein [Shewanella woodyi]ACA86963.1 surface antigen (D15) [Shewanella woodyi ATCC 51908]
MHIRTLASWPFSLILIISLLCPLSAQAEDWLKLDISGVSGELDRNIKAHLGQLPNSNVQRRAFIFNAEDNTSAALHSLGYYHGKVEQKVLSPKKGAWTLSLIVTPGAPTLIEWVDIDLDGEILNDPIISDWLNGLSIKPGDTLNHGVYEQVKSQLVTLALARGYFDGKYIKSAITINRDLNTARITLHYDSGQRYRIGTVNFEGQTLNDDLMNGLVPFKTDSPYSTANLGALNRELLNTGYFSNIKVLPQVDKAVDLNVPIKVELSPRPSHSIELGLGVDIGNTTEKEFEPRVRVTWRTPQINRYGHSQETSLEWAPDKPKFLSTYTIPLTHPLNDQLKIRVGMLRDKYGVTQVFDPEDNTFRNTGELEGNKRLFGIIRQQKLESQWLFSYSVEAIREYYTQSEIDYDPTFVLFGSSISKTIRGDSSLDPKSGFFQHYSIEYADPSLGSTVRLARLQTKYKWIDTFFEKHRIVSRLDLGVNLAADEDLPFIPPSLRYFAGGDQSIRGYSYQELGPYFEYTSSDDKLIRQVIGGRYLMVGSLEYQYYLTPSWRVATFVDAGNAFDVDQIDPIISVGGGIHWITPIGPIKLDVGVGLKGTETDTVSRPWRIHLTMGSEL